MPIVSSEPPVVGKKYGFLTILDTGERRPCPTVRCPLRSHLYVLFRCDCGREKRVLWYNVRRGVSTSCGCFHRQNATKLATKHGDVNSPLHKRWMGMHSRCKNVNNKTYGGKGITVCDEWKEYEPFRVWSLNNGFREDLQIDRIDGDKGYAPDNCRWVSASINSQNRSVARNLTAFGETKCLSEWVRDTRCKITERGILYRIKRGWSVEDAIASPRTK